MAMDYVRSLKDIRTDDVFRVVQERPLLIASTAALVAGAFLLHHVFKDPNGFPGEGYGVRPVFRFIRALRSGKIMPYLDDLRDRHGPIVSVRGPRVDMVFVFDPKLVIKIFSLDEEMIRPPSTTVAFRSVFGMDAIFGPDREQWRRVRRGFSVLTSSKHLKYAVDIAIDKTGTAFERWNSERGQEFVVDDMAKEMKLLGQTITALQTVGYSWDLEEEEGLELHKSLSKANTLVMRRLMLPPMLMPLLVPMSERTAKGIEMIRQKIRVALSDRLDSSKTNTTGASTDLVSVLASSGLVNDQEIEDSAMGGFTSARTNVANELVRVLARLTEYPAVLARARAEIEQHLGAGRFPLKTYEDVMKVEYIDAIVREDMRYEPIPTFLSREAARDVHIEGRTFKKGTNLMLVIPAVHWNEEFYKDARSFKPERWMGNKDWFKPFMYMPLGHGPRGCPGERLARMTVRAQLIQFITEFDWELLEDRPSAPGAKPKKRFRFISRWGAR